VIGDELIALAFEMFLKSSGRKQEIASFGWTDLDLAPRPTMRSPHLLAVQPHCGGRTTDRDCTGIYGSLCQRHDTLSPANTVSSSERSPRLGICLRSQSSLAAEVMETKLH
jgi:hypothetical protein